MFSVKNLSVAHPTTDRLALNSISLTLHAGEVLGIGGLMGAGRTELLMHLFGAWGRRVNGDVSLNDQPLPADDPALMLRRGLVLVSEDRRRYGLFLEHDIAFNLSLSSLRNLTRLGLLDSLKEFRRNQDSATSLKLKSPNLQYPVGKLSGGNQQKVVLEKHS